VLTVCPFCGEEFDAVTSRPSHFVENHDPSDAGLSPDDYREAKIELPSGSANAWQYL